MTCGNFEKNTGRFIMTYLTARKKHTNLAGSKENQTLGVLLWKRASVPRNIFAISRAFHNGKSSVVNRSIWKFVIVQNYVIFGQ